MLPETTPLARSCWIVVAVPVLVAICSLAVGAAIGVSWTRSDVIPLVLVRPGIGGFEPVEDSSIGNTWRRSEVKVVVLVKPGIVDFEPLEASASATTGGRWTKSQS